MRRLELPDADVVLHEAAFSEEESVRLLAALLCSIDWKQESIVLFGRKIPVPRLTAWYGEKDYAYSGILSKARPWTPELLEIKERAQALAGASFSGVLLNLYRTGADSMSWHADDEPELGPEPVIASVSLGATRAFQLKHKKTKRRADVPLVSGSLLVMKGATQRRWLHAVPKTRKPVGPRVNLTFRTIE